MTDTQPVLEIDVLQLARAAIADRSRFDAITRAELVALLGFVLQQNAEPVDLLGIQVADALVPALPASLAATVALAIAASDQLAIERRHQAMMMRLSGARNPDLAAAVEAFNRAFAVLKTRFEKEFPHAC